MEEASADENASCMHECVCVWHSRWKFSCQQPAELFDFLVTIRDSCIQIESVFLSVRRLQLECLDRFTEKRWRGRGDWG